MQRRRAPTYAPAVGHVRYYRQCTSSIKRVIQARAESYRLTREFDATCGLVGVSVHQQWGPVPLSADAHKRLNEFRVTSAHQPHTLIVYAARLSPRPFSVEACRFYIEAESRLARRDSRSRH